MTVDYEGTDFSEMTAFLRWRGTAMRAVLGQPTIWILLLIHCVLLYLHMELGFDYGMIVTPDIDSVTFGNDASKVSTTLLVFFVVYYGGSCYGRYYELYDACMGMAADVQCWVGLTHVYFPRATPDQLWGLSRHMVASVYFLYFEASGLVSNGSLTLPEAYWGVLSRSRLINEKERALLERYEGSRSFLMQTWALRLAAQQVAKPQAMFGADAGAELSSLEAHALSLREHGLKISTLNDQPIPFPMYHTLMLMLNMTLTLKAYAMIQSATVMSIPSFFIICFVCLGLKETAVALSDPFGLDAVDFETDVFMSKIMLNTMELTSNTYRFTSQEMSLPADVLDPPPLEPEEPGLPSPLAQKLLRRLQAEEPDEGAQAQLEFMEV